MFLHKENQQLLWQTLQKSPYLVEFSQKFTGYREEWFKGVVEQFYTQWISQNKSLPNNARELLEINKSVMQVMVADLKRLLGYSSNPLVKPESLSRRVDDGASYQILPSYNVAEERKRKEDEWSSNLNQYQSEYNRLLERPVLPIRELPVETVDEKLKNIEELVKEHAKLRELDLSSYSSPTSQQSSKKIKIMGEIIQDESGQPGYETNKSVHWS